jgi:4a-hydroxytetrahydrobiopterin dehydratase
MTLDKKQCTPCKEGAKKLNKEELEKYLNQLNNWQLIDQDSWLCKKYEFKDFKQSLEFVNKVGDVAEQQNHHPDIYFTWGKVEIKIQTHKIGGLHENDFILATLIDKLSK